MAKWLTRWSAKPVFAGSIPARCSIESSIYLDIPSNTIEHHFEIRSSVSILNVCFSITIGFFAREDPDIFLSRAAVIKLPMPDSASEASGDRQLAAAASAVSEP